MAQVIQIVTTRTYTYEPALDDFEYQENGVTSIEDALALDQKDYENGKLSLEELSYRTSKEVAVWSIVDE